MPLAKLWEHWMIWHQQVYSSSSHAGPVQPRPHQERSQGPLHTLIAEKAEPERPRAHPQPQRVLAIGPQEHVQKPAAACHAGSGRGALRKHQQHDDRQQRLFRH